MANLDNGKRVLREIIENVVKHNDTSTWEDNNPKWKKAIEDEMGMLYGDRDDDLCDVLAYVLSEYDDNPAMTALVTCYGIAYIIADDIIISRQLGEPTILID